MPRSIDDPLPTLQGDKDVSTPVHEVAPHMTGPGNDWLFPNGDGFPWDLRAGGWVYLRSGARLGARVRVVGIGFRDERRVHTGDGSDVGPGPTIEVDPSTWERVDHPLGELAESQQQGYRYLITAVDGTVTHLRAREAVPSGIEVDPPAAVVTATSEPPPDRFPGVAD